MLTINPLEKLKTTLEIIESVVVVAYAKETGNGMRCHEIARVTLNVLHGLGYENFRLFDGVFIEDNTAMNHSWIEGYLEYLQSDIIVETKPYDNLVYPNSNSIRRGELMIILKSDDRAKKYVVLTETYFFNRLTKMGTKIDFELVDRYSEFFTKLLNKNEIEEKIAFVEKNKLLKDI